MQSPKLALVVGNRLDEAARAWWQRACDEALDSRAFMRSFAGAGRRLGRAPLSLSGDERTALDETARLVDGLPLAQAGRVALLGLAAPGHAGEGQVEWVAEVFRTGSLEEQVAVLRALPLLPEPARLLPVAAAGMRTNAVDVLRALACDNPYALRHFDEPAFNQLVMKAVFYEVPLDRVVGLRERHNARLARMARDFADERRAAGRSVPEDLSRIEGDPTP